MSSSCRGVLIAGVSNCARTQMAEGILRELTGSRLFILSGGVRHNAVVHPLAIKVMKAIGIDISGQSVSTLEAARRQPHTYDVYISIDAPYTNRRADRYQRHFTAKEAEDYAGRELSGDPLLAPSTPSHWWIGLDSTDAQQRWTHWSPRDPSVFHEKSTRRLQDHIYEGEPLFMHLGTSMLRRHTKVTERWEVAEVNERYAMESSEDHEQRFVASRDLIEAKCLLFVRRLETYYKQPLLVEGSAPTAHHRRVHLTAGPLKPPSFSP